MAITKSSLTVRDFVLVSTAAVIGGIAAASAMHFFPFQQQQQEEPPQPQPQRKSRSRTVAKIEALLSRLLGSAKDSDTVQEASDHVNCIEIAEQKPNNDPFNPSKREGYLSWDDYFMAIAFLSAQRSKDPNRQVGACLVSQSGVILGIGYNGFPRGCSDDELPWAKKSITGDRLLTKYPYVCHAEVNAVLNTNHASAAGQRIYVTMFPCNECAKIIIQSGVAEVIYFIDKNTDSADPAYVASRRLLTMARVKVRKHQPVKPCITIDYK